MGCFISFIHQQFVHWFYVFIYSQSHEIWGISKKTNKQKQKNKQCPPSGRIFPFWKTFTVLMHWQWWLHTEVLNKPLTENFTTSLIHSCEVSTVQVPVKLLPQMWCHIAVGILIYISGCYSLSGTTVRAAVRKFTFWPIRRLL